MLEAPGKGLAGSHAPMPKSAEDLLKGELRITSVDY